MKQIQLRQWDEVIGGGREGVIADELAMIYPDLVYTDENGNEFVKESKIAYKLIDVCQDLITRVEALES